uniref:Carbohydrate deacetylase n=3 Tax=Schistosoma mansoni TaxID=6183 RepID=A0A3Q0KC05_SCHMA
MNERFNSAISQFFCFHFWFLILDSKKSQYIFHIIIMAVGSYGFGSTKIIVNADDGFYSGIRDQGIVSCLSAVDRGVSDVSVLMNGAVAKGLLSSPYHERPQMSLLFSHITRHRQIPGLHFNLTEGKPLSKTKFVPSLLNDNGCFLGKHGFRRTLMFSGINMNEVEVELESQINAFRNVFGTIPSHFDGHQHVHVLPGIDVVVASVISRIGIKWIRVPMEYIPETSCYITESEINFYREVSDQAMKAKEIFSSYSLKYTQNFIGMALMGKNQTIESLDQSLSSFNNCKNIEFMVHPGYRTKKHTNESNNLEGCGDPDGPDLFSQSSDREHEMFFLTSDEFKDYLMVHNYELLTFSDLS